MADVFISYASEDRDRVRPLAEALQARGFSVWWDRALAAGDDFSQVIQRELDAAKAVIVVWTASAGGSPWVRDEAARARDFGRLVPVLLDRIEIPLGFGQIHTEDLSAWNGAPQAAQIELLAEALKARVSGAGAAAGAVRAKAKRLTARIRIVSILSATAALVAIAAGLTFILRPQPKPSPAPGVAAQPVDPLAQLLKLVDEGKISGEEAVRLAELLQKQAFADVPAAGGSDKAAAPDAPATAGGALRADLAPEASQAVQTASAGFDDTARAMFAEAAAQLIQDPDPRIRSAVLKAARPRTRADGLQALWSIGAEGGPTSAAIYRACGALMAAVNDPRAREALEAAQRLNPQDKRIWQVLSVAYQRERRPADAAGAALVGQGLDAAAQGNREVASKTLETALPYVEQKPDSKAFVLGQLGDAAAARSDWNAAESRYKEAVRLHSMRKDPGAMGVEVAKLARAVMAQGKQREACRTLRKAREGGATVSDQELDAACNPQTPAPQGETGPLRITPDRPATAPAAPLPSPVPAAPRRPG